MAEHALKEDFQVPTKTDIRTAGNLKKIVLSQFNENEAIEIPYELSKSEKGTIAISPAMTRELLKVLDLISKGKGFQVIPVDTKCTTQQAANFLNVSHEYICKLLDQKKIQFTKIGRHRMISIKALAEYKSKRDKIQSEDMCKLIEMHGEEILDKVASNFS